MLMQAQPVYDAHKAVCKGRNIRTVYVTPQGSVFNQKMAQEFAKEEELILLCGHYEGIDERVLEEVVTAPGEIARIERIMLEHGAVGARMSGSGPTVFGIFAEREKADACRKALSSTYRDTWSVLPERLPI